MAAAGVAPRTIRMGSVPAARKLLAIAGLSMNQLDVFELNKAFGSQAIALGHPFGMPGGWCLPRSRSFARPAGATPLCFMCVGAGRGVALLLERVRLLPEELGARPLSSDLASGKLIMVIHVVRSSIMVRAGQAERPRPSGKLEVYGRAE